MQYPPAVLLLGQAGAGKSSLVEKLIPDVKGISSDAKSSFTRSTTPYRSDNLIVLDTPGTNSLTEKFEQNLWVAQAFNSHDISLILIFAPAEKNARLDTVVVPLRDYLERFGDLIDLVCPVITKMDLVQWSEQDMLNALKAEFGITTAIFSQQNTTRQELENQILKNCQPPRHIAIDENNFLKYFKIHDSSIKIMREVRKEVHRFEQVNAEFERLLPTFSSTDQIDVVFEYQAFMTEEITEAQKRVAERCNFTFMGVETANEAGHIANLTAQLKNVLFKVRTLALGFQSNHGVSDLRACPHCGRVWALVTGCQGNTECGRRVGLPDIRQKDASSVQLAHFNFTIISSSDTNSVKLQIAKSSSRTISAFQSEMSGVGCGKTIAWTNMAPVKVPDEFQVSVVVSVDDVKDLSKEAHQSWSGFFRSKARQLIVENLNG